LIGPKQEEILMGNPHNSRSPEQVAAIQERLQYLADHPGLVQKMQGCRRLDGLRDQPRDTRRRTDGSPKWRYIADYSSPRRDQDSNYGSGLL
jgi:hypothetical protein